MLVWECIAVNHKIFIILDFLILNIFRNIIFSILHTTDFCLKEFSSHDLDNFSFLIRNIIQSICLLLDNLVSFILHHQTQCAHIGP